MTRYKYRCSGCGIGYDENEVCQSPFCNGVLLLERVEAERKDDSSVEIRTTSATGGEKGVKPAQFNLIPIGPLTRLAEHYGRGVKKYSAHNWRKGFEWSKSYDALLRHLTGWWAGEEYDICPQNPENPQEFGGPDCIEHDPKTGELVVTSIVGIGRTCYNHTGGHHLDGVKFHAFTLDELRLTHPEFDDRFKSTRRII